MRKKQERERAKVQANVTTLNDAVTHWTHSIDDCSRHMERMNTEIMLGNK